MILPVAEIGNHAKAFAFLRVSGKGQIEGTPALRDQGVCRCSRQQDREGLREEGVSGATELENRPAKEATD
jgi:DNA invertase Pin-like site-specific DNA recombinase